MKKVIKIVIGSTLIVCGAWIIFFSGSQTFQGQLIWIPVLIAGAATTLAGVRVLMGHKPREIIRDLIFVVARTH